MRRHFGQALIGGIRTKAGTYWPISVSWDNFSKAVKAALERSGVRPVSMHDFRHGCVSVLLALGVPPRTVMEIVGHTALEMTMNVYAHVTLDDKLAALEKLAGLLEEEK